MKDLSAFVIVVILALWDTFPVSSASDIPFGHVVIDSGFHGDCKALGDIDGDRLLDVVVAGSRLIWYAYPRWTKTMIAVAEEEFTTDMQVGDVDGDGDLDIIVPDIRKGAPVYWFENPRPRRSPAKAPWPRHLIGEHGAHAHDVEIGDINRDGRLDVVTRKGTTWLWLQKSPDAWTKVSIPASGSEGLALGDIDGDGDLDITVNGSWIEAPSDPVKGKWVEHVIAKGWPDQVGITLADINKDGRTDMLLAPAESAGRLSWYETPKDRKAGNWTEHVICSQVDHVHTFKAVDLDNDGDLDVVFAEMAQSPTKRVGFFRNGGDGRAWTLQVVGTGGSHNLRVGDIGRDGDIDIVGANWQGPPVEMWENKLRD